MQMQKTFIGACGLALSLVASAVAAQSLSQSEINQLGTTLAPLGAEKAGNAAGTLLGCTGDLPADAGQSLANNYPEIPFKNEQQEFVITALNYLQYRENLTPGQIALFESYPET